MRSNTLQALEEGTAYHVRARSHAVVPWRLEMKGTQPVRTQALAIIDLEIYSNPLPLVIRLHGEPNNQKGQRYPEILC
jgi:hypothetical protein